MDYEGLLIGGYFSVAAGCLAIGWCTYLLMRRPMARVLAKLPMPRLGRALMKAFPATMLLAAISAFASVDYDGCGRRPYHQVVTDRAYILAHNRAQVLAALSALEWVIAVWVVIVSIPLIAARMRARRRHS